MTYLESLTAIDGQRASTCSVYLQSFNGAAQGPDGNAFGLSSLPAFRTRGGGRAALSFVRFCLMGTAAVVMATVSGKSLAAQTPGLPVADLAMRFAALTAVTGLEQAMTDTMLRLLPGAQRDRAGSAVLVLGTGAPRRLVVCPIDEPGYVVAGIRPDGYLTLRAAPGRVPPLFDQQFEGHRVTVHGARGPVPGVVGVRSLHLARRRANDADPPFTVDSAFVDIGAVSGTQVAELGIHMLAPIALAKRPHRYGSDLLAAPVAGSRAACAALVAAARDAAGDRRRPPEAGTVVVAFPVEQLLSGRGLATLSHAAGPFRETLVLQSAAAGRWAGLGAVTSRSLSVRYAGTPVETVSLGAADSLRAELRRWIGGAP